MNNPMDAQTWLQDHGDYLFRFAMLKVKDIALAEDMVQDALLAGISSIDSFSSRSSIRTWLVSILKNKLIDHFRSHGKEVAAGDLIDEAVMGVEEFFDKAGRWADMPKAFPNPDSALESKQFWKVYEDCLSRLKPQQAEVFVAREIQGMSNEEIRETLEISSSYVWVLMHRARLALGKCLEIHWVS